VRDLTIDGLNVAPGTGGSASPINLNLASAATTTMNGTVTGNTLTNSNSTTGPGLRMTGNGSATMTTLVQSNTISQVANRGIEVIARDGSNRINATIANNSVTLNNALSADAIRVDAGSVSTDTTTICADIRGNTATTTAVGLFGIRARQRFAGTTFILEDYAGAPTDDADSDRRAVEVIAIQEFLRQDDLAALDLKLGRGSVTPGLNRHAVVRGKGFEFLTEVLRGATEHAQIDPDRLRRLAAVIDLHGHDVFCGPGQYAGRYALPVQFQ